MQGESGECAEDDDKDEGELLLFDGLIAKGVDEGENEEGVVPALELLPARGTEGAEGIVAGCCEEGEEEKGGEGSGVVGEAEDVVAKGESVSGVGFVNVVEPGAAAEVDELADKGMEDAEDAGPNADVATEVVGDRIADAAKVAKRPEEESDGKEDQGGVGGGKAGAAEDIFVRSCEVEKRDGEERERKQRQVVREKSVA